MAAKVSRHETKDWCHLCGERSMPLADIWYPHNAEHGGDNVEYIRICYNCISSIKIVLGDPQHVTLSSGTEFAIDSAAPITFGYLGDDEGKPLRWQNRHGDAAG